MIATIALASLVLLTLGTVVAVCAAPLSEPLPEPPS